MLKFFVPLIMLIWLYKEWKVIQLGLSLLAFMLSLWCFHDLFVSNMGYVFGMYYLVYIMVILKVWMYY